MIAIIQPVILIDSINYAPLGYYVNNFNKMTLTLAPELRLWLKELHVIFNAVLSLKAK